MVPDDGRESADRLLARILTASLREGDAPERSRCAGRDAGRELVAGAGAGTGHRPDSRADLIALLDRLGFAPRPVGDGAVQGPEIVELHHCPFSDLAESNSSIVCSVHQGILEGALAELGGGTESVRLIPFVAPGLCAVHLARG
jgi:predicted ArsR family transcriptional regulator